MCGPVPRIFAGPCYAARPRPDQNRHLLSCARNAMDTIQSAAIIAAAGAAGLLFFGQPVWRALRARRWPHAAGTVTRSWTETVSRRVDPTESTSPTTTRINVRVSYRYALAATAPPTTPPTLSPPTTLHC